MEKNNQEFTFNVDVVAHVVQLLQLAILTGTDIAEQLLLMRMTPSDLNPNKLIISDSYRLEADRHIDNLVKKAEELQEQEKESKN